MRLLALAFSVLLVSASQSAAPPRITGLWSWNYPWTSAPAEIVKDSGPQWYASGLLLNLCDGGQLRLATGVLYRGTGPAILGSSDGLRVYEGEWLEEGESIKATYHLAFAEIEFTGMELAKRTQFVEHLHLENGKMVFSLHYPPETKVQTLRLTSAADAKQKVDDRFVECGKREPGDPSNKSLERTREG